MNEKVLKIKKKEEDIFKITKGQRHILRKDDLENVIHTVRIENTKI